MRAHRIRLFSTLALLIALGPSSLGAGPTSSPPQFLSLAFDQVDWLYGENDPAKLDSSWGQVSFSYKAARKTWYLNGSVKLPGSRRQSWFLRNLPLDGEANAELRRKAVFLDLRKLGLADGMDWSEVQYELTLDLVLRKQAPQAERGPITTVGTHEHHVPQCFASVAGPFDPGAPPRPILIVDASKKRRRPRVVRPLQVSKHSHCVAGSFARSLDWLNERHKLKPGFTVQQIHQDLLDQGVSAAPDTNGNGTSLDEWISAEVAYARSFSGGKIKTSVWDSGNALPAIQGVPEKKGDLLQWLQGEMDNDADVEIATFRYSGSEVVGRSFYMLTHFFTSGGRTYVQYRGDEVPGDDNRGDKFERLAEIYKGADGTYRFKSDSSRIAFAVSEAVN